MGDEEQFVLDRSHETGDCALDAVSLKLSPHDERLLLLLLSLVCLEQIAAELSDSVTEADDVSDEVGDGVDLTAA